MAERAAVFVLPTSTAGQQGPVAAWMSTAGWAAAARRVLGDACIVTPGGVVEPDEARRRGSAAHLSANGAAGWHRRIPAPAKTAVKDIRAWQRARRFRVDPTHHFSDLDLAFVWQRHELFHTAGIDLARALHVPSVLFVPATHIWEAEQWGVRRPGWRGVAERAGESPALRRADVVACGTDLVAEQVERLGARSDAIVVTPTGVDLDVFGPAGSGGGASSRAGAPAGTDAGSAVRDRLRLAPRFVVGWVGSFRPFHALEQAIDATAGVDDATLLLVGDGPERGRIEAYARRRGVALACTGTVSHTELPAHLAAMDVALVLARPDAAFHYSPLKLAEYLAAGRAVVVPRVPQLVSRLTDGVDAVFFEPGDVADLAAALRRLHDDPVMRTRLGTAARAAAEADWSWDHAVRRVLAKLRLA